MQLNISNFKQTFDFSAKCVSADLYPRWCNVDVDALPKSDEVSYFFHKIKKDHGFF